MSRERISGGMNSRPRAGTKAREHPRNALAPCPSGKKHLILIERMGMIEMFAKKKKRGRGCQKRTVQNRMFAMAFTLGRPAADLKNTHFQQLTRYASAMKSPYAPKGKSSSFGTLALIPTFVFWEKEGKRWMKNVFLGAHKNRLLEKNRATRLSR